MQQLLSVNGVEDIVIKKIIIKRVLLVVIAIVVVTVFLIEKRLMYNVNGVYNVIVKIVGFNIHEFID